MIFSKPTTKLEAELAVKDEWIKRLEERLRVEDKVRVTQQNWIKRAEKKIDDLQTQIEGADTAIGWAITCHKDNLECMENEVGYVGDIRCNDCTPCALLTRLNAARKILDPDPTGKEMNDDNQETP